MQLILTAFNFQPFLHFVNNEPKKKWTLTMKENDQAKQKRFAKIERMLLQHFNLCVNWISKSSIILSMDMTISCHRQIVLSLFLYFICFVFLIFACLRMLWLHLASASYLMRIPFTKLKLKTVQCVLCDATARSSISIIISNYNKTNQSNSNKTNEKNVHVKTSFI